MVQKEFYKRLQKATDFFISSKDKNKVIRLVSHHDADGICSAAIIISALNKLGLKYSISVIPQLDNDFVDNLSKESYELFIFTDLGSSYVSKIKNTFGDKKVIILDHHYTRTDGTDYRLVHVNPHLFSIEGSREISGAGVVLMFTELLDKNNLDNSHLAIIGAIGDCQERNGFRGFNKEIVEKAIENGCIEIKKGLKIFGAKTKPLVKLLKQSIDPVIPGISGDEKAVLELLNSLNIKPKNGYKWRMLQDLTEDELNKLTEKILELVPEDQRKKLIGKIYTIPKEEGTFSDAREISTLLNSCGRLGKSSVGIGACLKDEKMKDKALDILHEYKKEILDMLNWFKKSKKTKDVVETEDYIIINAKDNIFPSMAGTFASIISYSNEIPKGKYVMTMSRNDDNTTKISLRVSGGSYGTDINLQRIISQISRAVNGQSGGHKNAAGALIETDKEKAFIESAVEVFDGLIKEELIE